MPLNRPLSARKGGGEGFPGITGLAVSLDTWKNSVNPSNNFIGIANGPISGSSGELNYVATNTSIPAIRNTLHHIVVTTTSTGITVTMDGNQVLNYSTSLPPSVFIGFTGGTGGFNDIHRVQNVTITSAQPTGPTVSSISPTSGPAGGGTSVTITGTAFTGATVVKFANTAGTGITVNSSTSITATSPAGSGTVDIKVTTPGGTSSAWSADRFTYIPIPTISAVSPSAGPLVGGTSVTITGKNFTGASAVSFATASASFTVNSSTSITTSSPPGAGTVDIKVTTPGGTSSTKAADRFTYDAAPTVASVSPKSGPAAGGTSVSVTGTNFTGATAVKFGGSTAVTFKVNSSSSITATSPAGSGVVDLIVTAPGGSSATSAADQFSYQGSSPPTVTSVSPSAGPLAGGTSVTVTGANFTGATAVKFGGSTAMTFKVNSSSSITATSPAGSGTVDVTVATPGGTSSTSAADQFSYIAAPTVTSVSPASGPAGGGTSVSVTGANFTGATAVTFGATAASSFTVNSASSITTTSPAGSNEVDLIVTTPGGSSATSAADQFTYIAAPTVTSVSPASGPAGGGTSVSVTGANFTGATAVKFGGSAATTLTVNSTSSITATSPSGNGTVDVTVTTPGGTSATSAADQFSYIAAPTVISVSPSAGPLAGGTSVTVTGADFTRRPR